MFNLQVRPAQLSPRSLFFQQALAAAFKAHRQSVPRVPAGLSALLDAGWRSDLLVRATCREALCELRASVFHAPGRDADAQVRWHEAVATAVFAARVAQLRNVSIGTVFPASLLHRAGEVLALRILARVELEHRIKLDNATRLAWCSSHNEELTERLVRKWGLPLDVASCAHGWATYGELPQLSEESGAVYFGRLFAIELLQPDLCVPGAVDCAAADLGLSEQERSEVRAESTRARELIRISSH